MRWVWRVVAGLALPFAIMTACDSRVASDGVTGGTASSIGGNTAGSKATGGVAGTYPKPDAEISDAIAVFDTNTTTDADADGDGMDAKPEGGSTCPFQQLGPYGEPCNGALSCTRVVDCKGGPQTFEYACVSGSWSFVSKPCEPDKPYDSCSDSFLWCAGTTWSEYDGPEEPMPCPGSLPAPGSACYPTFGGMQTPCGYPCDPQTKTGWTIASCSGGKWMLDAGCE